MQTSALYLEQARREEQHRVAAVALSIQRLEESIERGNIDNIPAARKLIKHTIIPLRETLADMLRDRKRRAPDLDWYRRVGVDAAAILLLRTLCRNAVTHGRKDEQLVTLQRLCVPLGRTIMQEAHILDARAVNPMYMAKAEEFLKARNVTAENHTKRTMLAAATVAMREDSDFQPPAEEAMQVGKWAVQAGLDLGIIEHSVAKDKRGHSLPVYRLHPELEDLLLNTGVMDSIAGAAQLMVHPPKPWLPGEAGGYLTGGRNRMAAKVHKQDRISARQGLEESPALLSALNYLQSLPLELDQRGISIVRTVWADPTGGSLGMPSLHPLPEPKFPLKLEWRKETSTPEEAEQFQVWCHKKSAWYTAEKQRKTAAKGVSNLLREGTALAGRKVYSPTFPDWRSRIYYQGAPNPQGEDFHKACIQFHEKRPLGPDGLHWLKVHVANCLGFDKARLSARAAWTMENLELLQSGMYSPHKSDAYLSCTDYPVMAAVAVQELTAALESNDPGNFMSGLAVGLDATCSAYQHYSGLFRDPVGGGWVNMFDNGGLLKSDIYAAVLASLQNILVAEMRTPNRLMAEQWLEVGLDRQFAKPPTMTNVYGATSRGMAEYCTNHLIDAGWEVKGLSAFKMGHYLVDPLIAAMAEVAPAAAAGMRWIHSVVDAFDHSSGKPLQWVTPVGARIEQMYRDTMKKRVRVRLCGVHSSIVLRDLDKSRPLKMRLASAPNFVHSLDAAHLIRTTNRMAEEGHNIIAVHDSFATHAGSASAMQRIIRKEFVDMYEESNPLQSLLDCNNVDVPLPELGTLDIRRVLKSEWFFS